MPTQWGVNPAVSPSVFLLHGLHADRPVASANNINYFYWEEDTPGGKLFRSTGLAWEQFLGGITTDAAGSAAVVGSLTAGSATDPADPIFSIINGFLWINESVASAADGDPQLFLNQAQPLSGDQYANVASLVRQGTLNGHDYTGAMIQCEDLTASTGLFLELAGLVGMVVRSLFKISRAGGVSMFGAPRLDVQPIGGAATAGATYTAAEQTMLQAVYDAARATGMLS